MFYDLGMKVSLKTYFQLVKSKYICPKIGNFAHYYLPDSRIFHGPFLIFLCENNTNLIILNTRIMYPLTQVHKIK